MLSDKRIMLKINLAWPLLLWSLFVIVQCSTNTDDVRIVGGEAVTNRTQFPYQVSIRNTTTNSHFCGGIIIHRRAVLGAAHCFMRDTSPRSTFVVAGDLNVSRISLDSVLRFTETVINHAEYNGTSFDNDIALVIIEGEFTWTSTVNFLPLTANRPTVGTNCSISGWGALFFGGTVSAALMHATVPILNTSVCAENYGQNRLSDGMVCAGYMEGGIGPCQGDSGGALACNGFAAGIVSWGVGCAYSGYPAIFADVAFYRNWTETHLNTYLAIEGGGSGSVIYLGSFYLLLFSIITNSVIVYN